MKRLLIAVALVALMSNIALAEGMMFGIKGGVNMANLSGDFDDIKMKLAFGGGIWMNYAITEAVSVQPEILYMMKGAKADTDEFDAGFKLNYIDIPVLAKFAIPMEGDFRPNIFAGPYVGFLMSAKEYFEDEDEDIKDYLKSTEFGLVFGAGFEYMLGEGCITLDARYALGLSNIVDNDEEDEDFSLKNTGIQFLVGYGFAF